MRSTPIELEAGWRVIDAAISRLKRIIHGVDTKSFSSEEYGHVYSTILTMCQQYPPHDYKNQLYERYKNTLADYVESTILPSLKDKDGELLLRELVEVWKNHKTMVRWLNKLFHPLNRFYIPWSKRALLPLTEIGISCFYDLVFNELKPVLSAIIIHMIDDERDDQLIDCALVKDVLDIYLEIGRDSLGLYVIDFEQAFLKGSTDYYSKKAQIWMLEDSCPEYMFKAEKCLHKEKARVELYLQPSTEQQLLHLTFTELISSRGEQILNDENSGCRVLLLHGKTEELSRMYRLFSMTEDGLSQVSQIFMEHVKEEGLSLLKHTADAANCTKNNMKEVACSHQQDFVREIIKLHDKHLTCVSTCFQNHSAFHEAMKRAFEHFCNKDVAGCSSAESLAVFCDNILKKGRSEDLSYEATEELLYKVVNIIKYIGDKDLFAEFHRKKLARRLLSAKVDNDHETSFVSNLKQHFGGWITLKMEGMIRDMQIARDCQTSFSRYDWPEQSLPKVDFGVTILTTALWPNYERHNINLPKEMINCVEAFKSYYQIITERKKKLAWLYSMGRCNVIANFDTQQIELILSTYQAALLLLFNESDRLSYNDIVTQLNLPDANVTPLLHSLSCAKFKILNKEPNNQAISRSDYFQFNHKFTSKTRRLKVPLPPSDEAKKIVHDVHKDRSLAIDAMLVRIMKSRKVMSDQQLVTQCVEQLSRMFKPDIGTIKKRIEELIKREYLGRDPKMPNTYKYLA